MSIPDLDLTVRLVGLPLPELWGRYLALGGSATLHTFVHRIAGDAAWPPREDVYLAAALNDALIDEALGPLAPLPDVPAESGRAPAHPDGGRRVIDLDGLIEQSRDIRSSARRIRRVAQEARRRVAASAGRALAGVPGPEPPLPVVEPSGLG